MGKSVHGYKEYGQSQAAAAANWLHLGAALFSETSVACTQKNQQTLLEKKRQQTHKVCGKFFGGTFREIILHR